MWVFLVVKWTLMEKMVVIKRKPFSVRKEIYEKVDRFQEANTFYDAPAASVSPVLSTRPIGRHGHIVCITNHFKLYYDVDTATVQTQIGPTACSRRDD